MSKKTNVYYNDTNTCEYVDTDGKRCVEKLYPKNARQFNINEKVVWYCERHSGRYRSKLPNSYNNIKKFLGDHRTGNLDPNSPHAKGDNFEELTHIWKGVKILSKENDNYCGPLDHSPDFEGKIYQTMGKRYDSYNQQWGFSHLDREWDKEFDYEICYCADKSGKHIERLYIFPKKEIIKRTGITIYKNTVDSHGSSIVSWCEKYRISDEETLKKINEMWKKIIGKNNKE